MNNVFLQGELINRGRIYHFTKQKNYKLKVISILLGVENVIQNNN